LVPLLSPSGLRWLESQLRPPPPPVLSHAWEAGRVLYQKDGGLGINQLRSIF